MRVVGILHNTSKRIMIHRRNVAFCSRLLGKLDHEDMNEMQKTKMTFGSQEQSDMRPFTPTNIVGGGFKFHDRIIMGSIALLPRTVLKWNISNVEDINEAAFSIFNVIYPPIDLIIVGTGAKVERLNPVVMSAVRQRGVHLEIQDTKNACGTYNLLIGERPGTVGAVLLPVPEYDIVKLPPNTEKRKRLPSDKF
ncbi:NADH dehydrogenase [ubiquinone] 1 alpha subcomplex assembly factor 3-like [Styela clava]|uniref:NADH dehydrogenase [ubiquinone] 1 alpha subcomplex assembly factor 3-like n=1 Tax=Styela clava TaxID=7725 RepID=UPI00193AA230|nr:NADH dehydrogenase [ubiquinone] 1 alpha subcomplex assembly factor 3-like [Styela clava]